MFRVLSLIFLCFGLIACQAGDETSAELRGEEAESSVSIDPETEKALFPAISLVSIGDSLTAGTQDITTQVETQQAVWVEHLAASLRHMTDVHFVPPYLTQSGERFRPDVIPTNLAVPGLEVRDLPERIRRISLLGDKLIDVVPFHQPLSQASRVQSVQEVAGELLRTLRHEMPDRETWVFVWLGVNDVLFDMTSYSKIDASVIDRVTTSPNLFHTHYRRLLAELSSGGARRIFAMTIPQITGAAFFMSPEHLSVLLGDEPPRGFFKAGDSVLMSAVFASLSLTAMDGVAEKWWEGLSQKDILTADEIAVMNARVKIYNGIIRDLAIQYDAEVIEAGSILEDVFRSGVTLADGRKLSARYGEGLFSLDGLHPSHTGHALFATRLIEHLEARLGAPLPKPDLDSVYSRDPYRDEDQDGFVACPLWQALEGSLVQTLHSVCDTDDHTPVQRSAIFGLGRLLGSDTLP